MAFIKLSEDFKKTSYILLNSSFITDYMPSLTEQAIKVYLLGLYYSTLDSDINTIANFTKTLNLSADEIKEAYTELEKENLVKISNLDELQVIYLTLDNKTTKFKPIDEGKYGDLYVLCQGQLTHELTTSEFKSYVDLIENYHLEPEALLMIIKYCSQTKEKGANANYILAVCKNFIGEKIYTAKKVEEKIIEIERTSGKIQDIFKVLGIKRNATLDERDLYIKWTKVFFFSDKTIIEVAETLKKKGGMKALDNKLTKYHSMQFLSYDEITSYESVQTHLKTVAKTICTKLGIFLENLDPFIDNYLNDWLTKGYSDETLYSIATYCFKNGLNTLEKMNNFIENLYSNEVVGVESFAKFTKENKQTDEKILNIFKKLNLNTVVTNRDRELYNSFINNKISQELLEYAINLSNGKVEPWKYLIKILQNFNDNNIKTVEDANKASINITANSTKQNNDNLQMNTRSFSEDDLNDLFINLKETNLND
ncbi:MAG: hypothetical protein E7359_01660 [Clostridiales bacterium]|nr:hypothetical protein [Clostridiales bacterium]